MDELLLCSLRKQRVFSFIRSVVTGLMKTTGDLELSQCVSMKYAVIRVRFLVAEEEKEVVN